MKPLLPPLVLLLPLLALHLLHFPLPSDAFSSSLPVRLTVAEHHARFLQRSADRRRPPQAESAGAVETGVRRVFRPVEYGADPSGARDSSDAVAEAVRDAFGAQKGRELLPGVNDLGGIIVDLEGGDYLISRPIRFPSGGGNVVVQGGSLRASVDFPVSGHLIEVWSPSSDPTAPAGTGSVIYYEDITFRDILFDSNYTGGGLFLIDAARTRIDNCFFIHFSTTGVLVQRGHETFLSRSFLGQHLTVGGDKQEKDFTGTAVDLDGNDNAVTDVAIFSAATGIALRGQANIVTGAHCYNKATGLGGVGILVRLAGLGQTRIDSCYMDWTGIVVEDPVQVHVTNGFFLGNANVVVRSVEGRISGLTVVGNMFSGSGGRTPIVELDESRAPFEAVEQVVVDGNDVLEMVWKGTVARMTVEGGSNGTWVADFGPYLVFPDRINHVQYSLYLKEGEGRRRKDRVFPAHALTSVKDNRVVVESKRKVDGVVSIVVDQFALPGEKIAFR